jgi:IS30 family transposase
VKKRGTKSKWKKDDLIAAVIKMRLEEMSSVKTIIDFLMSDDIGMSKTTAYQYLAWAREEIKDQYDLMNPSKIEEAIGQYEEALERARQIKDWRLWNDLKKEMNKIQGVYAKQTMDITSNNKDFTPNEIIIKIIENGTDKGNE